MAPVATDTLPEPPGVASEESADEMPTAPLVVPEPLLRETAPPVEVALSPPFRLMEPPKPPVALPLEI